MQNKREINLTGPEKLVCYIRYFVISGIRYFVIYIRYQVFCYIRSLYIEFPLLQYITFYMFCIQYKSKETAQLIGLFSPNLVITNFMQCFLYGPIG